MSNILAEAVVYIDETIVFIGGVPNYLNAEHTPNDPLSVTDWEYLTCDGSSDGAYMSALLPGNVLELENEFIVSGEDFVVTS